MKASVIILIAMWVAAPALRAQLVNDGATNTLSNVTNTITGDLTVGTNGSFTLLVLSNNVLVTNSVDGVIGLNATAKSNEVRLVSSTARWFPSNQFLVGSNGSFNRLLISNGATVRDINGNVGGFNPIASNNVAVVTGSGSVWSNAIVFYLGFNGPGNQIVVSNGGLLHDDSAAVALGPSGSNNLALVTGSGSVWNNVGNFQFGFNGSANQLVISNGGFVRCGIGALGLQPTASNNIAVVTGSGSIWSNTAECYIGLSGPGNRLIVSSGGAVRDGNGYVGANATASNNLALVSGAGSIWSNALDFHVGFFAANNQVIVSNGGFLVNSNGSLGFNAADINNSALVTGSGSIWSNRSVLNVGETGSGNRLVVSNGGLVQCLFAEIGRNALSGNNEAVLTGAGSAWTMPGIFFVGDAGNGNRLTVSNSATLRNSFGYMGFQGSNNISVVTGPGSVWTNAQDFYVGFAGPANQLVVTDSGQVASSNGIVGFDPASSNNVALVTGSGSVWSPRSRLTVGESGSGNRLVVSNAGLVTNITGIIGQNSSSRSNEVTVTGPGSTWVSLTDLVIGNFGVGNRLVVSNGGQIQNATGFLGDSGSGSTNNEALVTGPGSVWTNGSSLAVGGTSRGNRLIVTNGGTVFGGNVITVGVLASATNNRIVVDGGALLVTNASGTGVLDVRRGTNLFNAGLIEVDQLRVTNKLGWIEFNGGTLITRGTSISNGSPFLIGISGSTPAVWDVRAGVTNHVITDFLDVGFNVSSCQLLVTNGASLSNAFGGTIGVFAGANSNSATISGTGSRWEVGGDLDVGFGASFNRLVVSNGGLVLSSNGFFSTASPSSNNLAVVTGPNSVWSNRSTMFIGYLGGSSQLIISNGGMVAGAFGEIGSLTDASNNLALITGLGSLWTNFNDLRVGAQGSGNQLVVSSGGVLRNNNGYLGGNASSSNNLALITGSASLWINRNELHVGETGSRNQLLVGNGGTVSTGAEGIIGNGNGSVSNNVTVTDGGSAWLAGSGLYVGVGGAFNRLVVSNGGLAAVSGEFARIGASSTANGNEALVTGSGSTLSNQFDLLVGESGGANLLVVSNGGLVVSSGGIVGSSASSSNNVAIVTGPNSVWANATALSVGSFGSSNRLLVNAGAKIVARVGSVGNNTNANRNSAILTDPGSRWLLSSNLYVGSNGALNSLVISNGALLQNGLGIIGNGVSSGNNIAFVTGAGSVWSNASDLFVGLNGRSNQLLISNGGIVLNNNGEIGSGSTSNNLVLVTGLGSIWKNAGKLNIGRSGIGNQLIVSNGGSVSCEVCFFATSTGATGNLAVVTGFGSLWTNAGLNFGDDGSASRLVVSNGGVVQSMSSDMGGKELSSNHVVVVTDAGSLWQLAGQLSVGKQGPRNQLLVNSAGAVIAGDSVVLGLFATSTNNRIELNGGSLLVSNSFGDALLDIRRGTNVLNAGLINVQNLLLTNTLSFFELNGGTLRTAGTTVSNGRVFTVGNGTNPATLQLQGGTHSFSNNLVIANNASLIGNGTILGDVSVQPGGFVAPGTSIGKLSFSNSPSLQGTLVMEISKSGGTRTNDQIQVTAPLTYNGSLIVTNSGTNALTVGDRFQLFTASTFSSSFSSIILPPLPSGLIWTNKLALDGSLEVTLPAATLTIQRSNNVLTLSWPTNALSYCLETAFDVTPPVHWQPVADGIVTNASSFVFSLTNTLGTPKQFFRLAFPCAPAPAPSLFIQLSSNLITVSWPSNAFRLETALSLAPPVSWQTISNGLSNSGSLRNFTFTNHPAIPNQFFRLAFP